MADHGHDLTSLNGTSGISGTSVVADLLLRAVPATAERLPVLRNELVEWAQRTGMPASDVDAVALAAYEAMANVVAHAYGERSGTLDLCAAHEPRLAQIEVVISDNGRWVPPGSSADGGGCGLPMIHRLAGDVEITTGEGGTTVRMTWSVPAGRDGRE